MFAMMRLNLRRLGLFSPLPACLRICSKIAVADIHCPSLSSVTMSKHSAKYISSGVRIWNCWFDAITSRVCSSSSQCGTFCSSSATAWAYSWR